MRLLKERETALMDDEVRTVRLDPDLQIEAYRFEGIMQAFPNHFHDYYVIGCIEKGRRYLQCNNKEFSVNTGDILVFNPLDTHACNLADGGTMDYRSISIKPEIMKKTVFEITGEERMPRFTQCILYRSELAACLRDLHQLILDEGVSFEKDELYLVLIEQLLREHSDTEPAPALDKPSAAIRAACGYLERNYAGTIKLDDLSAYTGLSKYHLIRSFTRQKGITPYNYLETVRIGEAKKLLEKGAAPVDAAMATGFSDQSHFSNLFKRMIGLTPGQYAKIFTEETRMPEELKIAD